MITALRHLLFMTLCEAVFLAIGLVQAQTTAPTATTTRSAEIASLERNGKRDASYVHDPSTIAKCKEEYWFFSTGIGVSSWRSKDGWPVLDPLDDATATSAVP